VLLVDTNVLIEVLEDGPVWADWSIAQLQGRHPAWRLLRSDPAA
jgi:hypothetical protein